MNKRCHHLISEIETYFREGIVLNDDNCHFIRSTFSDPAPSELMSIINDPSNPDRDSLMELIFSPDDALQMRIETLLSGDVFRAEDETDLAACLAAKEPAANIVIPGYNRPVSLKMPAACAPMFILRLRITKTIDRRIADAIDGQFTETAGRKLKVRIRNSNFNDGRNCIDFLSMVFRSAREGDPAFPAALDFLLLFFEEMTCDSSIGYELFKRQRHYKEKIREAVRYEEQLKKSNMETMMMQGRRNKCINIVDLQEKIDIINYLQNITRAVHEWADKP